MELKDLVVTPLFFILILTAAYFLRPVFTTPQTRRYFIPALVLKMVCAILLGVLYQFYYGGGDTFQYHTHGSRILAEAIVENPEVGIPLFFLDDPEIDGAYEYYSRIQFFGVPKTFVILRIGALFDVLTFGTYSATALLFALFSFIGLWMLYSVLIRSFPDLNRSIAWSILFVPTVLFWGSGILRDTLTIGALGIVLASLIRITQNREMTMTNILLLVIGLVLIYTTKVYFLICLVPAMIVMFFFTYFYRIRSVFLRVMLFIPLSLLFVQIAYLLVEKAVEDNPNYALDNIAETARITAYDIGFYTGRSAGSTYSLGELDGTFRSMIRLAPNAIIVSLFRPFVWEVRNPLMFLSALESFLILMFTLYALIKSRLGVIKAIMTNPIALSFFIFALGFAFAVGISTYNFGTLSRYRIPVLGPYLVSLVIGYYLYRYPLNTNFEDEQSS